MASSSPRNLPGSMGPPGTITQGMFRRPAAIRLAGTILSQVAMITMPSSCWASTVSSMESTITSRLGSTLHMPTLPWVMPSQMAMVLNSKGTPPARYTPCFTASATLRRWTWPGFISLNVLTMPMNGRSSSSSSKPTHFRCARLPACSGPSVTTRLR